MKTVKLSDLFKQGNPHDWGLRGDPHLWQEFESNTTDIDLPETEEQFIALIHGLFERFSGTALTAGKHFFVEKYQSPGMSGGMISLEHWNEVLIPLLIERFLEIKNRG